MIHLRTLANLPFFKAGSWRSTIPKHDSVDFLCFFQVPQGLERCLIICICFTFFLYNDFIYGLSQRYLRICVSMRLVCSPSFAHNCLVEQEQLLSHKDIDTIKRETTHTNHNPNLPPQHPNPNPATCWTCPTCIGCWPGVNRLSGEALPDSDASSLTLAPTTLRFDWMIDQGDLQIGITDASSFFFLSCTSEFFWKH